MVFKCDTCGEVIPCEMNEGLPSEGALAKSDQHERENLDHWMQYAEVTE
jgi:hypothetical protein